MSDANEDGERNAGRIDKVAESVGLRLMSRGMMLIGMPLLLALGSLVGSEVWGIVKATSAAVNRIDTTMIEMNTNAKHTATQLEIQDRAMTSRFESQSKWIQKNAEELEKLKEKVWTAPPPPKKDP